MAHGTTASAGDTINYILKSRNSGGSTENDFVVYEQVDDILEYADVVDKGGATLNGGSLTWPKTNISADTEYIVSFKIKIKSPIATTPRSSSDPESFDLRMDNVYGNVISIKLPPAPEKVIELASADLPETGPAESLMVFAFFALVLYFYNRNRQLLKEVKILRNEQAGV